MHKRKSGKFRAQPRHLLVFFALGAANLIVLLVTLPFTLYAKIREEISGH